MKESTDQPAPPSPERSLAGPAHRYSATLADQIETRWQAWWDQHDTFVQPNPGQPGFDESKPKFYCLDMFPYPSGAGLHVGHPEGYTATDILCRYKRMTGFNVLHPMGWDAFGLPAEQYAIQTGVHPAITTANAIDNFRRQLKRFGFSYDWSREIATIDPAYYRWTQWIWLRAYNAWFDENAESPEGPPGNRLGRARPITELITMLQRGEAIVGIGNTIIRQQRTQHVLAHIAGSAGATRPWSQLSEQEQRQFIDDQRLAYLGEQTVNWCPKLGTALANEEVIDGRSERGGHPVFRKPLRQWMFRITAYAERLLHALPSLDWPESTRTMQREWIGRSEGAEIDFALDVPEDWSGLADVDEHLSSDGAPGALRVFTTRPDTLFGATYMVVAPEHPLVDAILAHPLAETDATALRAYAEAARNRSDVDRQADNKEKTGVFTGARAINPATGKPIPIWTADYVLMGYGTGAIMAVPAHDQRDYEFATAFNLPIVDVVYPRAMAAMAYYANNAIPEETTDKQWRTTLADFLGLVTSSDAHADRFAEILSIIRSRRDADRPDAKPGARELRGAIRTEWLDTMDDMDLRSFDDLKRRISEGAMHLHAESAFSTKGIAVNSSNDSISLDGLDTDAAKREIVRWLESQGIGTHRVNYKLRDWLFSRQRYWGEPFPIVYDERGRHYPVSDAHLPVALPDLDDYQPEESEDPRPLLAKAADWVRTTAGKAGVDPRLLDPDTPVRRETNTMPGWAGSCWYYLRYCDPTNARAPIDPAIDRYWMGKPHAAPDHRAAGVDLYIGGAEHAVLHLLYARFWHKMLYDLGHVSTPEPFAKLFHQGLILSYGYMRADKSLVAVDQVMLKGEPDRDLTIPDPALDDESLEFVERGTGEPLKRIVCKMSKSLKNVVNPDEIIERFGADAFRLYEMYIGPLEASQPWRTNDLVGLYRFLQRAWRLIIDEDTGEAKLADSPNPDTEQLLHRVTVKVAGDIERLAFNTAIAAMIEFVNAATSLGGPDGWQNKGRNLTADQASHFVRVLSPFVPHMAEELWSRLGHQPPASLAEWPTVDDSLLRDDEVEVPVQIMGKVRHRLMVPADADAKAMEEIAMADDKVRALLDGKTVRKIVAVPGKMINIVAN
ncbi:MAG: leucine--tRNA ligase [Phycisphaerales bacterium]